MRQFRIYQASELSVGAEIELSTESAHHLRTVLRAKPGTAVILFNGRGGEYHAVLETVEKRQVIAKCTSYDPIDRESSFKIHLCQALLSHDKMDLVIQKAVELGVDEITPVITQNVSIKLSPRLEKRYAHWQKVIIHACQQSGLNRLPKLNPYVDLKEINAPLVIFEPSAETRFKDMQIPTQSITIAVGPEGGFSQAELQHYQAQGASLVRLSPRILRTETCAITAVALCQYRAGDE